MKNEEKIPLLADKSVQPIDRLLAKCERIKKLEVYLGVLSVFSGIATFVFIYVAACLAQAGLFRRDLKEQVWTFIEIVSLVLAVTCVAMHLVSRCYVVRGKANLRSELDEIHKLDKVSAIEDAEYQENLKLVEKCLKAPCFLQRAAFNFEFAASLIFLASELIAVIEIFVPYGLRNCHKSLGIPVNLQSAVDFSALTLVIVASVLKIMVADEQRRREHDEKESDPSKKQGRFSSYFALPLLACLLVICSTIGKVVQSMENSGAIVVGRTGNGTVPVGYIIRAISLSALIVLGVIKVFSSIGEHAIVNSKLDSMDVSDGATKFSAISLGCADLGGN
ncbi:putative membrane protein [Neorickettsia helminthoeca str. Oregon]|uniref:Putative membrane protein n=1 Tax=Neorickettsia helminthoeca str. Oregon TaxID=1286528 RepID=X5H4A8_9RICK|nr:hypothetical protein [Neorickettsia helminthoeca]AHX11493.1 putative membrane protein [Neorickettsia helminthoeca str. Oregon]